MQPTTTLLPRSTNHRHNTFKSLIRRHPLAVAVSIPYSISGTAVMLLVMAWKHHISFLSISMLLRIIMLIEAVCAGFFMSIYIGYVHQYNSLDSQPVLFENFLILVLKHVLLQVNMTDATTISRDN